MASTTEIDRDWPPGTVKLQALLQEGEGSSEKSATVILQPRPTDDPNDPLNWPKWQKSLTFGLTCFYTMIVYSFVNATTVTWNPISSELGFTDAQLLDAYAIGCATLAIGAPLLVPFALKFGARPVYTFSSLAQLAMALWSARASNFGDWMSVNAIQCFAGSLSEVLVQMTIADLYFVHQRGLANNVYIWVSNVGQNLAIVAAGYVTLNQGWRWVWWWFVIFFGIQFFMFFFGFEETKYMSYATLHGREGGADLAQHRKSLSEKPGQHAPIEADTPPSEDNGPTEFIRDEKIDAATAQKLSTVHINRSMARKPYRRRLGMLTTSPGPWSHSLRHAWQPVWILFTIPGVLYSASLYGLLTAWTTVMTSASSIYMLDPPYNFNPSQIGLLSLAPFIGGTLGSLVAGPVSDWLVLRLSKRNDGIYEPEMRFWVFLPFVPFLVAGSWWFAYSLANGAAWSQVAVAYAICWFGIAPIEALALTYVLDAYNEIVGDSLTAITIVRNLWSTIFVFALPAWIDAVGIPNVFNTIGAIGILVLSFAAVFLWKGKEFRYRTAKRYKFFASRQFEAREL